MSQELPFDPFPFVDCPHRQTIISSFFNILIEPASVRKLVTLPDGDVISLEITTPQGWKPTDPTVVLVHGLGGSHQSPYLIRLVKRLIPTEIRAVRFNMRSCGSGKGLSRKMYHCGRSDDLFECIKVIKRETPDSEIILAGFSLGGNIVLKLAGELGSLAKNFFSGIIAVSPPVDLFASVDLIGKPANAIYENYFYKILRADVHYIHNKFKELPRVNLPKKLKLYEYDEIYTAPFYGFENARDYYNKCSSINVVDNIILPCKILLSEDDPIVSSSSLDGMALPQNIAVFKTKKGGHMGYLGRCPVRKGIHWLDSLVVDWIQEF